jgi:PKD domain
VPQQAFGAPQKLTGLAGPAVGLDATGLVTLVGNQSGAQVARTWPVGGTVPAAGQTLASNCSGAFNQLAEAPNGDVIAGFNCSGATFARRLPGSWRPASTPIPDTAPNCGASLNPVTRSTTSDLRVAVDAAGDPFAVALEAVRTLSCPLSLPTDTFALNLLVGAGTSVQPAAAAVATGVSIAAPDVAAGGGSALVSWSTPAVLQSGQHVRGFNPSGTPVTPAQVVGQSATSARGVLALSENATPPQLTLGAIPARATAGVPATFSASASDFWGPVTVVWNFGDGSTARGSSVKHVYAAAGHPTVTATAIDAVGNSVSAATAVGVGRSVPIVSNVSETHSTFRGGSARTAIRAAGRRRRTAVGTTFGFTLNVDAAVAVRIDHAAAGLVSGHRCVAPSRRLRASNHRHCTRTVVDGTLQRHGHRGGNRIGFSGRIGRRALGHGAHRATIVATAAGASGRSRHLNFVIVP